MDNGILLISIGVVGLVINTILLILYTIKINKENELRFITLRTLSEPKTAFLSATTTSSNKNEELNKNIIDDIAIIFEDVAPSKPINNVNDMLLLEQIEDTERI